MSASSGSFSFLKGDRWIRPYFAKFRPQLLRALGLGLLTALCAALLMFFSGYLISRCAEMPDQGIFVVLSAIACVQLFGIGKPIVRYLERLVSHDWVFRMTSDLRRRLYNALESRAMNLKTSMHTGDILGLVAEDIGHVQNLYLRTIFPAVIGWVALLAVSLFNGVFDLWFALAMFVILALVAVVLPALAMRLNKQHIQRRKELTNERYTVLTDNVLGAADWVIAGRGKEFLQSQEGAGASVHAEKAAIDRYARINDLVAVVVFAAGALLVLVWAAGYFTGTDLDPNNLSQARFGGRPANWIAAFVLGFFPLVDTFAPLSMAATQVNTYRDSVERFNALHEPSEANSENTEKLQAAPLLGEALKGLTSAITNGTESLSNGLKQHSLKTLDIYEQPAAQAAKIQLDQLCFAYEDGNEVLHQISLRIPTGQKLAILGRSGSGKSTLAALLRGDLVPTSGRVTINNQDAHILEPEMHRYLGVVQQNSYVFNRTLRDNLLIGRADANDKELLEALKQVGLDTLLDSLPQGLDTMVDEAGKRFSGGQRHRISLARVLLSQAPAILLDEPTVGLDPITEQALLDTLFKVAEDKTLVMITHHLQDIERFNRVIFIEDGQVEMDGSPAELQQSSPRFRALRAFDLGISQE